MKKIFLYGCLLITFLLAGCGRCSMCYHKPILHFASLRSQGIQVIPMGDTVRLILPSDTFFKFNSAVLRPSRVGTLTDIAQLLHNYHLSAVYVSGHTDDIGTPKHKDRLSTQQAKTIAAYLWNNGVKLTKLGATGYGDKNPVASNRSMWGSAANRRVEIFVHYLGIHKEKMS